MEAAFYDKIPLSPSFFISDFRMFGSGFGMRLGGLFEGFGYPVGTEVEARKVRD